MLTHVINVHSVTSSYDMICLSCLLSAMDVHTSRGPFTGMVCLTFVPSFLVSAPCLRPQIHGFGIPSFNLFLPCMGAQAPVQQLSHTASVLSSSSLPWWASALKQSMRSGQGKGGKQKRKEKKMSLFICVCFVGPHCVCVRFVSCLLSLVLGLSSLVSRLSSLVSRLWSSVSPLVFSLDSRLQSRLSSSVSPLVFSLASRLQSLVFVS
ncbi:unnamed protein product [Penicillium olsonii]|uniref:Uncharacterized protein n=1 Tax=Penicillium olsonii TaxID=99116 RepID=A0A9W4MXG0_PENOL|nr:unnamed protein product [Penicillium olsonii]CAG8143532.1 unnamed protein product [Penicillium olsonii]